MSRSRTKRFTALLAVGVLVAALIAPATAFALVGEPVPGAEIFLQQQPGDEPIANTPDAGDTAVNPDFSVAWDAGALSAANIVLTVGQSPTGEQATDGRWVRRIVAATPHGTSFPSPLRFSLRCPPGLAHPQAYKKNTVSGRWEPIACTVEGDWVNFSVPSFSYYGVGGIPMSSSAVPASSPWSLAVLALLGGGVVLFMRRHERPVAA